MADSNAHATKKFSVQRHQSRKRRKSSGVPSSGSREVWTLNQAQGFLGQDQKNIGMANDMDLHANISYKQLHERFVSDLNGTSLFEINAVTHSAPVAVLLRTILSNVLFSKEEKFSKLVFCW